ncbi:hypothetical protein [Lysobacter enzymogenes]|uniref:hypothetical protein n=1 Tax=Lysobacter enzymogenes TaxID=69 RepID=UPI0011178A46|nr:hypothetical protein [Lysobacter enzymogenes]UZW61539.1 hypothetical protein BV903_004340 [Lysobacter enzymogenes]
MNVRDVLESCGVRESHFAAISEAIPEGYAALERLAKSTPMLNGFMQGRRGLSYLRDIAVQHALEAKAAQKRLFYTDLSWNASHNYCFLKLQVGQVVFTTHYAGVSGSKGVRKAVARAELTKRTSDLFTDQGNDPDACVGVRSAYAQIVHGGLDHPKFGLLRIPNRDQISTSLAPFALDLKMPEQGQVEEVEDRLHEAFKEKRRGERDGKQRDAS